MHLNAFIRHARSVRMANLAQLVNVLAPMVTAPDDLLLQSTFHPFELYSATSGPIALDVGWVGDTFTAGDHAGVRYLDVSATLDEERRRVAVYVVNRRLDGPSEVDIRIEQGRFADDVEVHTIHGSAPDARNTFAEPDAVTPATDSVTSGGGSRFVHTLAPHSVTGLIFDVT